MSQSTVTQNPEAFSPDLQRAETQQLVAQSALLLEGVTQSITKGDALLASSQEDANNQLQAAEQVATANTTEKAKKESEMMTKLEAILAAPDIDKLSTTLESVLKMRTTGIDDESLIKSLKKDGVTLEVAKETPKEKFFPTNQINTETLPDVSVRGDLDGLAIDTEDYVSVSTPGYKLTAKVGSGHLTSSEGPRGYESIHKYPIINTEYSLQVGEDIIVSDDFKGDVTVDDMHGSRVQLGGEDASAVGAHLPGRHMQLLEESRRA